MNKKDIVVGAGWALIPARHKRQASGAATGAAIGAVLGSILGGPVGAVIGASLLGGLGASLSQ